MLFTFVAILCVDKLGRKPLLLVGNVVQAVALFSVGYMYSVDPQSPKCCSGS